MKTLLFNASIVDDGSVAEGYLLIDGDEIAAVGHGDVPSGLKGAPGITSVDCGGDLLMPGAIDTHVHFREPGLTAKGDIGSESRAAVAGGVTSFLDMPNTKPATTTLPAWEWKMERAALTSAANYAFFLGATNDNAEVLLGADYTRVPGVKLFMGSSTGNMLVDRESTLQRLFAESPALIMVHAEDERIISDAGNALRAEYGDRPIPVDMHSRLRPREACVECTRHAVELAVRYGARLHVAHISTADELKFFTAGDIGEKRVTAETCPHYLIYSEDDMKRLGSRIKCNPAIKTAGDRDSLRHAVELGIIDTIATDHAPHLAEDKAGDLLHAASGMPGVQFSLPLMLGMYDAGVVARLMSHNPARLFRMGGRGFLREGYKADVVRVKRLAHPHTLGDSDVVSRCGWTPYAACRLHHAVEDVWVNGCLTVSQRRFTGKSNAQPLRFNCSCG